MTQPVTAACDWNFDTFLNIIQRCSDLTAQRPIYGLQNDCSLPSSAIDANGSNTIIMRNGKYVCGYSSDASINALEWVRKMNQTGCIGGNIDNDTAVFALKTSEKAINIGFRFRPVRTRPTPQRTRVRISVITNSELPFSNTQTTVRETKIPLIFSTNCLLLPKSGARPVTTNICRATSSTPLKIMKFINTQA